MKQTDIKIHRVYRNRGAGTTQRKVIGIGLEFRPYAQLSRDGITPDGPGIEYVQRRQIRGKFWSEWSTESYRLWLDSFAAWADSEVAP